MYFVLSDVHGCYTEMEQALTHWNKNTETLVVMGDLVDRGPDSFKVIQALQNLQEQYGDQVVVLAGNHDHSFSHWAGQAHPEMMAHQYKSSHDETIKSFYMEEEKGAKRFKKASRRQRGEHVRFKHKKELRFLLNLPVYFETDHCVFVHAGLNLKADDWRMDTHNMTRIREEFYLSETKATKRVFFGHTPTSLVRSDSPVAVLFGAGAPAMHEESEDNSVWYSEQGDKVGLDGGVSFGGQLNAVRVDFSGNVTETVVVHAVSN